MKERVIAEQKGLKVSPERMAASSNLIKTLIAKLLKLFGLDQVRAIGSKRSILLAEQAVVEAEAISNKADAEVKRLKLLVADFQDDPVELTKTIESITKKLIPDLLDRLESMTAQERQTLTNLRGEVAIKSGLSLPKEAFEIILRHMPVWAVTTLAAGSRIPLEAGLFDYIIFDEAAQTDIGSALPLLYRGKNAVVVGDPQQLSMISNLDPRDERVLLGQNDLLRSGIGQFSQGQTSLFDLVTSLPNAQRYMLTDHFRCHPEIAAYINEAFYGRRLTALTDVKRLKIPPGMSAGLHWTDITGEITRRSSSGGKSGSAASEAEAQAIALEVERLTQTDYVGTIGIVTFFDYQAQLITKAISRKIPPKLQNKHRIKVFTANKFQGDERDVIMMSLCMHPDMPRGAKFFIQKEKRLLNVAVSRARAICHIFGDMDFAGRCGIAHIEGLARKVKLKKLRTSREERDDDRFDSIWERRLYEAMTAAGLSPIPQYPVGGRFLDLALVDEQRNPPLRIDVEVDGVAYHQDSDGGLLPTDLWRNYQLQGLGWKVLRFWVYELRDDMEGCVERIRAEAAKR